MDDSGQLFQLEVEVPVARPVAVFGSLIALVEASAAKNLDPTRS